jgi:hypothetical protein
VFDALQGPDDRASRSSGRVVGATTKFSESARPDDSRRSLAARTTGGLNQGWRSSLIAGGVRTGVLLVEAAALV